LHGNAGYSLPKDDVWRNGTDGWKGFYEDDEGFWAG